MNNSQQYINDYLNCGMMHFRTSLTPMDTTGDLFKDRAFREELLKHCEQSQYWEQSVRDMFVNTTMDIVIDFSRESGGICHNC
jgi:hypothetical protein